MRVGLIACSKTKRVGRYKARELYCSPLFRFAWQYTSQHFDRVFILSAKYGLLDPERRVCDYDTTLNTMTIDARKRWSVQVAKQILQKTNTSDELHLFCGKKYREFVVALLRGQKCFYPLHGLGIGQQLQWYKERL
ncbi:MAG: hypothetical protein HYT93_00665 [Parcubacteria group bacterium]|nr:hypothetical protein [Parcubacteria group bacterium]